MEGRQGTVCDLRRSIPPAAYATMAVSPPVSTLRLRALGPEGHRLHGARHHSAVWMARAGHYQTHFADVFAPSGWLGRAWWLLGDGIDDVGFDAINPGSGKPVEDLVLHLAGELTAHLIDRPPQPTP